MLNKKKYMLLLILIVIGVVLILKRTRILNECRNLKSIVSANSLWDIRFADAQSQKVYFYSDSLRIVGDFFKSSSQGPTPCILILHGTHVLGRKQPIILSIAEEFQKLGYSVLTIDFRGYNDSEDPESIKSLDELDFAQDIISAINFLCINPAIDTNRIFIVGHSFGAGAALSAIEREQHIEKYVLFGAPRRVRERILDISSPDRPMLMKKNIDNMKLKYDVDTSIALKSIETRDIEKYIDMMSSPTHRNKYFLIDGENEDPKDLKFYKEIAERINRNAKYYTIRGSNHYLNTGFLLNKPAYDHKLILDFVNQTDMWLNSQIDTNKN